MPVRLSLGILLGVLGGAFAARRGLAVLAAGPRSEVAGNWQWFPRIIWVTAIALGAATGAITTMRAWAEALMLIFTAWLTIVQTPIDAVTHRLRRHDTIIVFTCVVTVTVVHEAVVNSVRSLPIVLCGVGVVVAFAVLHLASPRSLGWGDVLLVAPLTLAVATVSPSRVVPWLLAASCMAAAHGLVMRVRRGERFVAFGPHLLAAAWLIQVVGV